MSGQGRFGHVPVARHLAEHPGQLRGAERLAPRRRCRRSAPACGGRCAPVGWLDPAWSCRGLKCCAMKPSSPGLTLRWRLSCGRFSAPWCRGVPPGTSSADQHGQHGARPAAFEGAPAVVDRLAEGDRDRDAAAAWRRPSRWWRRPSAFSRYSPAMRRMVAAARRRCPPPIPANICACARPASWGGGPSVSAIFGWRTSSASTVTAAATRKRPSSAGSTPGRVEGHGAAGGSGSTSGLRCRGRADRGRPGRPDRARRCGRAEGHVELPTPCSRTSTWMSANMKAGSVLGRIGTHSDAQAPVIDRWGRPARACSRARARRHGG